MKRIMTRSLAIAAISVVASWAGALTLEIGKPEADPQAKSMNAILVARVTACAEPAKSQLTANWVHSEGGELRRTQLKVIALNTPGMSTVSRAIRSRNTAPGEFKTGRSTIEAYHSSAYCLEL